MKNFYSLGVFLFFVSVLFIGIGITNALAGAVPTTCFGTDCTIDCEDQPGDVCDGDEGTSGADVICGSDDVDIINAGKGEDKACGHDGNDIISGGQNDDCLRGDDDNDTISGGLGKDLIEGGYDDDILDGGRSGDRINGDGGADDIFGGDGADTPATTGVGFADCDTTGGLFGGAGNDYIEGGDDVDTLDGVSGTDECDGGPDNDIFANCDCGDEGPLSGPQAGGETETLAPCL